MICSLYVEMKIILTSYLGRKPNQMVTLYAGDSGEAFTVHKEFACHYSPVLKAAFNSNFVEGQTQTYRLQETTERAVRLLVQWFYTQKLDIFVPESEEDAKSGEYIAAKVSQDMSLVELWILAEKLLIPALQNLVAKGIEQCRLQANAISTTSLHYVYEKTERGSLLRRLMVDICFSHLRITSYLTHPDRYPQEMLIELVTVFLEMRLQPRPEIRLHQKRISVDTKYQKNEQRT
jgi:hypothetical protein